MTWGGEQTMSDLVPDSACQEQLQDLKLSRMMIKPSNVCLTILIVYPVVILAVQHGYSSALVHFELIVFHFPSAFLKIKAPW